MVQQLADCRRLFRPGRSAKEARGDRQRREKGGSSQVTWVGSWQCAYDERRGSTLVAGPGIRWKSPQVRSKEIHVDLG